MRVPRRERRNLTDRERFILVSCWLKKDGVRFEDSAAWSWDN
jgi:hypothetical protein